jgi:ketosteroid isomerase-like protein
MSEENVEVVRRLLEAFANRDHERAFDFYDPDIEWDVSKQGLIFDNTTSVYRGHDGVREYWRQWLSAWRDIDFEVEEILDGGDDVVALIRNQRQWGRLSGIETEVPPYGLVFTFREAKVVRWCAYRDRKSALEAAGLSE